MFPGRTLAVSSRNAAACVMAAVGLAGERGFRDFSRLPPAQENRGQPADPPALFLFEQYGQPENVEGAGFMATDTAKHSELVSVLKSVINVLEDGQKGMEEIGEHLKDENLKHFFLAESLKRANFRGELENELHRQGVHDVHESGTTSGALYRAWAGLKARLGGGDHRCWRRPRVRRTRRRMRIRMR